MPVPLGYTQKKVGDTVVVDLPGHKMGEVVKVEVVYDRTKSVWALVRIGFQETWFPGSLLFVIPPHWNLVIG